jgi:SnoaL-like protein
MDARFHSRLKEGAMRCDSFRRAAEALDLDATIATFSPSIVLRSPVRDEPLEGREAVGRLFAILYRVFEDLRFVGSYTSTDGAEALHFMWRVGDREGEGVDMMRFDADGLIDDYRVMVRPLTAVVALRDAAFSQLPEGD